MDYSNTTMFCRSIHANSQCKPYNGSISKNQLDTRSNLALDGVQWPNLVRIVVDHNLNNYCYYRETCHVFKNCPCVDVQL